MPPVIKQESELKRNLQCYFKRSINKFKLPLSKVMNVLKNGFFAKSNWNLLNNNDGQCDAVGSMVDENYMNIFAKLLLKLQISEPFQQNDYFIQMEKSDSSRYYATYLWNSKFMNVVNQFEGTDEYLCKCMARTILKMTNEDLATMKILIMGYCQEIFPQVQTDSNLSNLIFYLLEKICDKDTRDVLIELIHLWFLKTPLLEEFSKYVGWTFLNDIKACLLNVDDLYELFINQCYKKLEQNRVPSL